MKIKKLEYKFLGMLVAGFLVCFFGVSIVKGECPSFGYTDQNCNDYYLSYLRVYDDLIYGARGIYEDCKENKENGECEGEECDCSDEYEDLICEIQKKEGCESYLAGNGNNDGDEGLEGEGGGGDGGNEGEGAGDQGNEGEGDGGNGGAGGEGAGNEGEGDGGNEGEGDGDQGNEGEGDGGNGGAGGEGCSQGSGCNDGEIWSTGSCKCICDSSKKCCGIQLNTVVPFIGDCIEMNTDSSRGDTTSVTSVTAFPILVQGLMKILMSAIMVFSFLMVIIAGLMMTTGAFSSGNFAKGKTILKNVIISLILLGCSGLILSLVNPSFFGG